MSAVPTQLVKLTIEAYQDLDYREPAGIRWQAPLNPTELSFARRNRYAEQQAAGSPAVEQSYAGRDPDQVQIDLLLDGTGVVGEPGGVGAKLDALLELTRYRGETHQPYYVQVWWGRFSFRGYLDRADVTYKLFDRTGEPLRAAVKLTLTEAVSPREATATARPSTPDLYQTWLVKDGERLDAIAARIYGDPAYWRPLAAANRLVNPRALVTGTVLLLPPLGARR